MAEHTPLPCGCTIISVCPQKAFGPHSNHREHRIKFCAHHEAHASLKEENRLLREALQLAIDERHTELDMMHCEFPHGTSENAAWHKGVEEAWRRFDIVKAAMTRALAAAGVGK